MIKSKVIWMGSIPYDFTDKDGSRHVGTTTKAVLITTDFAGNTFPEIVKCSAQHSLKVGSEGVCYYDKHGRLVSMG